jgi:chromosome segregation ATPase
LSRICQDQDRTLKANEVERAKFISKNDELAFELKNLQGKLKSREDNLSLSNKQLEDAKTQIAKLQMEIREYDRQLEIYRNDISSLNDALEVEKAGRYEAEKANDDLTSCIHDRDREITRLMKEIESYKGHQQKLSDDKLNLGSEIDSLRKYILVLTEQNQKVLSVIILAYL